MGSGLKQASKCANKKVLAFEAAAQYWVLIDNGPEEVVVEDLP